MSTGGTYCYTRYPGSIIREYVQKEHDELTLPLGPVKGEGFARTQALEGRWTRIVYEAPKGRSVLEVYRNYEGALQRSGFQVLYACANQDCGASTGEVRLNPALKDRWSPYGWPHRQLSAKLARPAGDVYVSLHVLDVENQADVTLHIIETKPMETGLVTVDAAALAGHIARTGHASVYGIYFDTGKWDVKPASDAALREIAKVLQQDPALRLHVVGHTDNVGDLAMNLDLSRKRAGAVVQALRTKHGVAAARLRPDGVGPLSPVASNDGEDGRARNRRVELVKQ